MQVTLDGQAVSSFAYNKARVLLAYLAVASPAAIRSSSFSPILSCA